MAIFVICLPLFVLGYLTGKSMYRDGGWKESVHDDSWGDWLFVKFLRLLPGFWRLWRDYGFTPFALRDIIRNYEQVLLNCTGGKLSKVNHDPDYVTETIAEYFAEEDDGGEVDLSLK